MKLFLGSGAKIQGVAAIIVCFKALRDSWG